MAPTDRHSSDTRPPHQRSAQSVLRDSSDRNRSSQLQPDTDSNWDSRNFKPSKLPDVSQFTLSNTTGTDNNRTLGIHPFCDYHLKWHLETYTSIERRISNGNRRPSKLEKKRHSTSCELHLKTIAHHWLRTIQIQIIYPGDFDRGTASFGFDFLYIKHRPPR